MRAVWSLVLGALGAWQSRGRTTTTAVSVKPRNH
jgi:hypothetical protein